MPKPQASNSAHSRSISEKQSYNQPQPLLHEGRGRDSRDVRPVPVEAGELTFAINVNVNWDLECQPLSAWAVAAQPRTRPSRSC